MFGLRSEDFAAAAAPTPVWPENVPPLNVFLSLSTQWRAGFGGAIGLDYTAIPPTLELLGIPRHEWAELFDDLRTMELTALETMRKD